MEKYKAPRIKICGLTRPQDIEVVNEVLPDYIGFVFWEKSKRNITKEKARQLKGQLDRRIKAVGVFVDADIEFVADLINCDIIDIAQLHGEENDEYIKQLRKRVENTSESEKSSKSENTSKTPIIKAFNINFPGALEKAEISSADYVMLDPGKGSGITFDWSSVKSFDRPYFLAGGLNPENVDSVIKTLQPFAVDVSSGVETDGVKDAEKIRKFVNICRS